MATRKFSMAHISLGLLTTIVALGIVAATQIWAGDRLPGSNVPDGTLASIRAGCYPQECNQFGGDECSYSGDSRSCPEDEYGVCTCKVPGYWCKRSSCESNDGICEGELGEYPVCEEYDLPNCCCNSSRTDCHQGSYGCDCGCSAGDGLRGACTCCDD